MRIARRAILSSYAGPMPRPVVPIARSAARLLARLIEQRVRAQDQRARRRNAQPLLDGHAARLELVHLLAQRVERHDDAVADQADDVVAQDARGNQVQHGLAIADHERVARRCARLGSARPRCARSASTSTTAPLPSSPHCVPITTTFRPTLASHAEQQQQVPRSLPPDRKPQAGYPRAAPEPRGRAANAAAQRTGTAPRKSDRKPNPQEDLPRPKPQASVVCVDDRVTT